MGFYLSLPEVTVVYLALHWVSQSAWIAVVKYHKLSGLHNRHLFLTVWEAGKSKTKGPANSLPGESPVPGLETSIHLLSLHNGGEKGKQAVVSLYKGTNPIMTTPPSDLI